MVVFVEDLGRTGLSGLLAEGEADPDAAAGAAAGTHSRSRLAALRRHRPVATAAPAIESPGAPAPVGISVGARSPSVRAALDAFHAFLDESRP